MADDDTDLNGPPPRTDESPSALNSADPVRNFSLGVGERIRALTIGVPAWAARKRRIEDAEERHVRELVELHDTLVTKGRSTREIELAVVAEANAINLTKLNELVRLHNRYYPIEANLAMDRKTGNYLVYGRAWTAEEPYSAARFVALARAVIDRRNADRDEAER